jgi:hypothetical protein
MTDIIAEQSPHPHQEIELKTPTAILDKTMNDQKDQSEKKTSLFGTFWRKVAAVAGLSLGADVAGKALLVSRQSIHHGKDFAYTIVNHGGALTATGLGLVDAGLIGLLGSAAAAIYGLFRKRGQNNGEKS